MGLDRPRACLLSIDTQYVLNVCEIQLSAKLGRTLTAGAVHAQVLPVLRATIDDVRLAGPTDDAPPQLALSRIEVRFSILRAILSLGHDLEARIETDGMIRARVTDDSTGITTRSSGFADVSLGLKWHSSDGDEKTGAPSTAWLFHLDMNSGSAPFRGDGVRPSLRFVAEWELPGDTSIGVMPGLARDTDDNGRRFTAGILAVTVSTEIAPGWHAFVELAGQRLASRARGGNLATLDGGVAYLISPDMQVDASFQRGITRNTPFLGLGLGWSIRF